jgi:hypothetical protein
MNYKFTDFTWLASANGFNYPIDVYHGSVHLGTLEAKAHAFVILSVDTPTGKQSIRQSKANEFKSKNLAAEVLHRTWKTYRSGGNDDQAPVVA